MKFTVWPQGDISPIVFQMFSLSQNFRRIKQGQGLHPGCMSYPKGSPFCCPFGQFIIPELSNQICLFLRAYRLETLVMGQEGNPQEQCIPIIGWLVAHLSPASAVLGRKGIL